MSKAAQAVLALAIATGTLPLAGQVVTLGSEFQVNAYTTSYQYSEGAAPLPGGGFVVTWRSSQGASGYEVSARRYASSGATLGTEFMVNSYTTQLERNSSVASWPSGFVVVWQTNLQDGSAEGVFGQRFDTAGAPVGPEFRVNAYTTGSQASPAVAADASGNFVVVWYGSAPASSYDIIGQRFSSTGSPLGGEFTVNTYTTNNQITPAVAADAGGSFVVVWRDLFAEDGNASGVFAQRFASNGAPSGGEFRVNTYTSGSQYQAAVASLNFTSFVVVWRDSGGEDGAFSGVFGQRFSWFGGPLGPEFRVNSYTTNDQLNPSVAADSSGSFVVAWESSYQNGARPARAPLGGVPIPRGVFAQLFASGGSPLGAEFRVNTTTSRGQIDAKVGMSPGGSFVIAWTGDLQDGSNSGIFAQRYCIGLTNVSITVIGPTTLTCPNGTGGFAPVTDSDGGASAHQWGYRTVSGPMMTITDIPGQTGTMYVLNAVDFPGPGAYYLVERTTPTCGPPLVSNEVTITVTDGSAPLVTPPLAATVTQTLCQ